MILQLYLRIVPFLENGNGEGKEAECGDRQ